MIAMDDNEPAEAERKAFFSHFEDGGRRFAERAESNPWIHEWRRVIAKADRAGDCDNRQKIIDDFVRRLKADERRRHPR